MTEDARGKTTKKKKKNQLVVSLSPRHVLAEVLQPWQPVHVMDGLGAEESHSGAC